MPYTNPSKKTVYLQGIHVHPKVRQIDIPHRRIHFRRYEAHVLQKMSPWQKFLDRIYL